jgi:drug/metabolite transporter (DMT)-like permease
MLESFKKNKKGIFLMVISAVFVCFGQLFWKLSSDGNLIFLILGFLLYGISALVMIYAYRFGSLSVLQPVLSLSYVITIILAITILKEQVTLLKIGGVLFVILGVILIAGGDK